MKPTPVHVFIVRIAIGALFFSIGFSKMNSGWLVSSDRLLPQLETFQQMAHGPQTWYLENIAIPYAGIWSKLISAGETAIGISLLLGLLTRLSSVTALLMLLNICAANGELFSLSFFGTPWGALLFAGLLMVFLARAGRWGGLDALLVPTNPKGFLW
jgi:uncharacterized membrane protein YphA (DoxX/SURF4 family)